jgi:hypothetical protein
MMHGMPGGIFTKYVVHELGIEQAQGAEVKTALAERALLVVHVP